jgi:hypothetical protein
LDLGLEVASKRDLLVGEGDSQRLPCFVQKNSGTGILARGEHKSLDISFLLACSSLMVIVFKICEHRFFGWFFIPSVLQFL